MDTQQILDELVNAIMQMEAAATNIGVADAYKRASIQFGHLVYVLGIGEALHQLCTRFGARLEVGERYVHVNGSEELFFFLQYRERSAS